MTAQLDASGVDPGQRIAELRGVVGTPKANPNELLAELRFRLDAVERCPSLTVANLHRECVCHLMLLLDRVITLGGQLPHQWQHRGGRAHATVVTG